MKIWKMSDSPTRRFLGWGVRPKSRCWRTSVRIWSERRGEREKEVEKQHRSKVMMGVRKWLHTSETNRASMDGLHPPPVSRTAGLIKSDFNKVNMMNSYKRQDNNTSSGRPRLSNLYLTVQNPQQPPRVLLCGHRVLTLISGVKGHQKVNFI